MTPRLSPRPRCRGWSLLLAVSAAAACIAPARAQALTWMTPRRLNGQQGHAMAYDIARQRVVLFGGADHSGVSGAEQTAGNFAGTWEWDGSNWAQRTPATSPPGRRFHAMAYDAARQRVVLFGGEDLTRRVNPGNGILFVHTDTWEWDGNDWTQRTPSTNPSARLGHAMAYDVARQCVVMFGGWRGFPGSVQSDTWEWDGTNWTQRTAATSPGASAGHAMAYDIARQRVVLYGGSLLSGTWEWDGTDWTQRSPAPSPQWRRGHAMAYDAARQRTVLFGGWDLGVGSLLTDTWEWDGSSWTQRRPSTNASGRAYVAMVFDVARQRTVMFEGSDTWEWDGNDWSRRAATASPPPRTSAMAYDAARQRVVLFGGRDPGWNNQSDTWEWDGSNWAQRSPATSPGARWGHAMACDIARGRVVLFGGSFNVPNSVPTPMSDTWEWDGSNWTQQSPAASPSARWNYAMAYDIARARVVLFGGSVGFPNVLDDTWEWDGNNWALQAPATNPSARSGHAMAYDVARERIVLFGGWGANSVWPFDTCEWDGSNWTVETQATQPPLRTGHAMAYDVARQRTVVFGGYPPYSTNNLSDTWEWDGSNWTRITPSMSPPEHCLHAMAYDLARQRVVLFGGAAGEASDDTWLFGPDTPAVAQPFGTACAGSSGAPVLTSSAPYLGNPAFALDLLSARAASPCAFGLSAATQSLPIGPCTLHLLDPFLLALAVTNATGFATTPAIALPLDSALRGVTLFAQAAVVDPQATPGIAFTAGRLLVLGD